ncbi:MAG: HAMP domain-containing sensor histidine kinase [Campylobacterota bacterium]|nr:HAMP domain-containing sensor histidine kinase [Campylobacterota bacterium]
MDDIKKLRKNFLLILITLIVVVSTILFYITKNLKTNYLQNTTQKYTRAYDTVYTQYKEISDVVFSGLIRLSNAKERLNDIEKKNPEIQNKIRKKIYNDIIKIYNTLKSKHIKSINFILPSGKMFLKVKDPLKYNQLLSKKRYIIHKIQDEKKPISGYEIGEFGAGFRFAYPIFDKEKYLGILSITFGAEAITSGIMKQYYVLSNFYVNKNYINKNLLEKKYKPSHYKGFLYDLGVLKELKKISRKDMSILKPSKSVQKKIFNNILSNKAQTIYDDDIKMTFTTIPVKHTVTNETNAVISIRSKEEALNLLFTNYFTILFLIIALICTIVYLIYEQNLKRIEESERLKQNSQKDKQLLEQSKMAQMGEMIGNIAHQWRQPLSVISTSASGVKVSYEFDMLKVEELPKNMDVILKNVKYLSNTIDTFRDFIKEKNIEKQVVLQDKIDEVIDIIKASLDNNYIDIINNIDYTHKIDTFIMTGSLSQVLMNIINNAKDAMVQNNIENRWIKIELNENNNMIILTVEDNGGGIPQNIMDKIFDPYFTTKYKSQGTGLGLYMSMSIMKKHLHGTIKVDNTKNGAKFSIEFPRVKEKENIG